MKLLLSILIFILKPSFAFSNDAIPVPDIDFLIVQAEKNIAYEKKQRSPNGTLREKHPCLDRKHPICRYIHTLNPNMPLNEAIILSNSFSKVAKEFKIPPQLLISIAWQESSFKLDAVRNVNGLVNEGGVYKFSVVGSDFCMMQINAINIKNLEIDPNRLLTDVEYCLKAGARILTFAKAYEKKDSAKNQKWWTRYNASNEMHRDNYEKAVMRHWRKLDPQGDVTVCQKN